MTAIERHSRAGSCSEHDKTAAVSTARAAEHSNEDRSSHGLRGAMRAQAWKLQAALAKVARWSRSSARACPSFARIVFSMASKLTGFWKTASSPRSRVLAEMVSESPSELTGARARGCRQLQLLDQTRARVDLLHHEVTMRRSGWVSLNFLSPSSAESAVRSVSRLSPGATAGPQRMSPSSSTQRIRYFPFFIAQASAGWGSQARRDQNRTPNCLVYCSKCCRAPLAGQRSAPAPGSRWPLGQRIAKLAEAVAANAPG